MWQLTTVTEFKLRPTDWPSSPCPRGARWPTSTALMCVRVLKALPAVRYCLRACGGPVAPPYARTRPPTPNAAQAEQARAADCAGHSGAPTSDTKRARATRWRKAQALPVGWEWRPGGAHRARAGGRPKLSDPPRLQVRRSARAPQALALLATRASLTGSRCLPLPSWTKSMPLRSTTASRTRATRLASAPLQSIRVARRRRRP